MKDKSFDIKTVVLSLCWGIALAGCIENKVWYAVGLLSVHIGLVFFKAVDGKWMALRMWACYLAHVATGVYLTERGMVFFWVIVTSIFVCDAYQQLTGEHIVTLFNLPAYEDSVDELEEYR